jgi:L-ascorbate metabolism protein UlaG (beta-lactamase superfamily)
VIENIHRLGRDSFRLDGAGAVPADVTLITHEHRGHFDVADIFRISTEETQVVGLSSVIGAWPMTAAEAAEACDMIAASMVVPMHRSESVGTEDDATRFAILRCTPVSVLPLRRG